VKQLIKMLFLKFGIVLLTKSDRNGHGLFNLVVEYYLKQSSSILHIGAHFGQEAEYYHNLGKPVLWIEANTETFLQLASNISKFHNQIALNLLAGSKNEIVNFYVTSNRGLSSSALNLSQLGKEAWKIDVTEIRNYKATPLDQVQEIEQLGCDFWVIDVQGFELEVIHGAKKVINQAKYLLVECSDEDFYESSARYSAVKTELEGIGFAPILPVRGNHFEMLFCRTS